MEVAPEMQDLQSAQFLRSNHRLVATLKLWVKSKRMVSSQPRPDVGMLKDERVAEEFANRLSWSRRGMSFSEDPEELWSARKTTILVVIGGCIVTHRQVKRNFVSQGTLNTIDQC